MGRLEIEAAEELLARLDSECRRLGLSRSERVVQALEGNLAPLENMQPAWITERLKDLEIFLRRVPGITWTACSKSKEPQWWIKLSIDIKHPLAWRVVQELGHVLNYLSIEERLPTVFMPVSPPPYLNGGPADFLSWAIEARIPFLDPKYIRDTLEGRLPRPVDDLKQWSDLD